MPGQQSFLLPLSEGLLLLMAEICELLFLLDHVTAIWCQLPENKREPFYVPHSGYLPAKGLSTLVLLPHRVCYQSWYLPHQS